MNGDAQQQPWENVAAALDDVQRAVTRLGEAAEAAAEAAAAAAEKQPPGAGALFAETYAELGLSRGLARRDWARHLSRGADARVRRRFEAAARSRGESPLIRSLLALHALADASGHKLEQCFDAASSAATRHDARRAFDCECCRRRRGGRAAEAMWVVSAAGAVRLLRATPAQAALHAGHCGAECRPRRGGGDE